MIQTLSVTEAQNLITQNKSNHAFTILDVRTPEEFEEEHLEKAVNIDIKDDDFKGRITELNKEKTYLVHCHSGTRAKRAAELMKEMGFKKVYCVQGLVFGH